MMLLQSSLQSFLLGFAVAFQVGPCQRHLIPQQQSLSSRDLGRVFATTDAAVSPSIDDDDNVIPAGRAKDKLLDVATSLKEEFGVFILDKKAKDDLLSAADELESVSERPAFSDDTKRAMMGEWTLVCTTSSFTSLPSPVGNGIDTSKLPFFNVSPVKDIRKALNKCLVVQQVILAKDLEDINRVDHILEYQPPKNLRDILDTLPSLNINPLDVTKGKVVLVHEANVSDTGTGFSIQLKLASIVLNVAGTSQYLDPNGADVLGINSPLKEFQAGTFETTYLDDDLRISRTTMGSVKTLRVYVRSEKTEEKGDEDSVEEEYFDEFDKFAEEEGKSEDVVDVEVLEDDVSPSDS